MAFLDDRTFPAMCARLAAIAAFAFSVAVAGVFTMPPLDRDESRFAQATVQMLETGDFIAIRFQEDERNKKPAGIHWLQAASVSLFSSVEAREIWAYRLPSLAGAVLAALFTYAAGARLFGARVGFIAAILFASAPAVAGEATIAKTDAALLACVTAAEAMFLYIFAAIAEGRRAHIATAAAFWIALGAGALIKGPVILMILALTSIALAAARPKLDWLRALRPVSGLLLFVLMITPWAVAVQAATDGRFFAEAVGGDMVAKIGAAQESHSGPPGYHALLAFALFWPAAALLPAALKDAVVERCDWRRWFLISWIAPAWLVFELTATKLPHYALPLYPPLAILVAECAVRTSGSKLFNRAGAAIYVVVGLLFAATIAMLPKMLAEPTIAIDATAMAAALALASLGGGALFWRGRAIEGLSAAALISAALAWTLLANLLPQLDRLALSPRLSTAIEAAGLHPLRDGAPPVALAGYYEPSAVFLLGTKTVLGDGRQAAGKLKEADRAAAVDRREEETFLAETARLGLEVYEFASIDGLNYSNGKEMSLRLYRRRESTQRSVE